MLRQNLKEHWPCFQKWHKEFGKCSPEHLKVSKLGLWWDSFVQSRTFMSLKLTGEFCLNDNEEWCKTWKGIELSVQNWNEDFDEFWPEPSKISKISILMGLN